MIICARCGASNKAEAELCRMCAGPLAGSDAAQRAGKHNMDASITTLVMPNPVVQDAALDHSGVVLCPSCRSVNREGWAFCSQCGKVMEGSPKEPAPPSAQAAGGAGADGGTPCPDCPPPGVIVNTLPLASTPGEGQPHLRLLMEEGESSLTYQLKDETAIGRADGDITFPHDGFVSSQHARIIRRGQDFILVDEGSRNGTFLMIKGEVKLEPGDTIAIGRQLLRFEP